MKVIKKNKKHLWVECKHCGSILEPKEKDFEECTTKRQDSFNTIIRNDIKYIFTKKETVRWIFCPVCRRSVEVDRKTKESYEPLGGND